MSILRNSWAAREGRCTTFHRGDVAVLEKEKAKFENSARVARAAAEMILKEGLPDQVLLNVNVPSRGTAK